MKKRLKMTFDEWWDAHEVQYINDSLHMSDYHMAFFVWSAAIAANQDVATDHFVVETNTRASI